MADITIKELYTHPGLIWLRCIELYEAWLPDDTVAWTSTTTGLVSSRRALTIVLTGASDTTTYVLIDVNTSVNDCYHFSSFFALPGMGSMPKGTPLVVGSRTVTDVYGESIELARRTMVEYWTNSSQTSVAAYAGYNYVEIEIQSVQRVRSYNRYGYRWLDSTIICYYEQTTDVVVPGDQNLFNQPKEGAGVAAGGGGGGSVDLSPVVEALNDIAMIDVDYSANNGGVVFSLRGRVRNE